MAKRRDIFKGLITLPMVGVASGDLLASTRAEKDFDRDYFKELGVRTFINAAGTYTALTLLLWPLKAISAGIQLTETIDGIPEYISEVYRCGRWKHSEGEGYFRIVYVEWYFGNSLLYIQWIKDTVPNGVTLEVMKTLSIKEFNADDHIELTFKKPKCKNAKGGIEFDITADSGHDENIHKFELKIFSEPGKYTIKHAEF